ncbi:MAG: ribulose-phosphate 3-epimerase, partial [Bacteroidales bacterium]|nr:ribulose-phosphate 3-epimerase [Bacteroidales bacterium]
MSHLIAPSILTANFLELRKEVEMVNSSEADWIHLDIMDGVFVPNMTFGFPIIKLIKEISTKPLDTHLMIVEPDRHLESFLAAGADMLTVHYEACTHLDRTIDTIKSLGMKAGVAINPHTSVQLLENILPDLDLVLNMTVNPGYGAQSLIEYSYRKIRQLRELIAKTGSNALIQIDGGVGLGNLAGLKEAGVDVFVVGNTVFAS